MSNQNQLILNLQQYIVELQTENKALKGHIYTLQNKQESLNSSFHDDLQKLKIYIEHCEHQIMKREKRQIGLLELVSELEETKDLLSRQRDVYLTEVETLREEMREKDKAITQKVNEVERTHKQMEDLGKLVQAAAKPPPPKPAKCKQCQVYVKNTQLMQDKLAKHEHTILNLQKDIACLSHFL